MRVYELAKSLDLDSKRLIALMKRLGMDVKNHMSTLDDDTIEKIKDIVAGKSAQPAKPPERPSGGSPIGGTTPAPRHVVEAPKERSSPSVSSGSSFRGPQAPADSQRSAPGQRSTFVPPSAVRSAAPSTAPFEGRQSTFGTHASEPARSEQPLNFESPRRSGGRRPPRDDRRGRRDRENLKGLGGIPRPRRRQQPSLRPDRTVTLDGPMTVSGLSQRFGVPAADIIKQLMALGILATINQEVDLDTAEVLAAELGVKVEIKAAKLDL